MQYKAIVFDLDGTAILNSRYAMPSPRLIKAAQNAKGKLRLIAATGRPASHALPVIQALELQDPCVISGGTVIVDPVSGKILREARLEQEQLDAIRQICMPFPYKLGMDDVPPEQRRTAAELRLIGSAHILFIPDVESRDLTYLVEHLSRVDGALATSTKSWSTGHVIHVTTKDGSKEHGIGHVLEGLGIGREETIGVGDGDNDVHLFAAVGHRIAMGNASEQLKAIADEIAPSVDEDGLAWVIERYS